MFNSFGNHNLPYANTSLVCNADQMQLPSTISVHSNYTVSNENEVEISQIELNEIIAKLHPSVVESTRTLKLNVSSVKEILSSFAHILTNVDRTLQYLEVTKKNLSEEDWSAKCSELDNNKELLLDIDKQLGDPNFVTLIEQTVRRAKAKRTRRKRLAKEWQTKKKLLKEAREEKHKKIDLWMEKMQDEVERARRTEMMKNEADVVLSDITLKKIEAKRILGLLNSLTKLRIARVQQMISSGQRVSESETETFITVIDKLKAMWVKQLKEYNIEEHGLKVMLNDAEAERVNVLELSWKKNLSQWTEAFYGRKQLFDPLQAQPSEWEGFIHVRREWDRFVTTEDSALSSCIPPGWVIPVEPSTSEWAKFSLETALPSK